MGHSGGVRRTHPDGNWIRQGGKRGAAQQDDFIGKTRPKTVPRSCTDGPTLKKSESKESKNQNE